MTVALGQTTRSLAPLLYAAGEVVVVAGVVKTMVLVEGAIGFENFTTLYLQGDVATIAAISLIGGVVFGALAGTLVRLEDPRPSGIRDHLRHCLLLYAAIALSVVLLVENYNANYGGAASGVSGGYVIALLVSLTASYAVLIDALILVRAGRRSFPSTAGESP